MGPGGLGKFRYLKGSGPRAVREPRKARGDIFGRVCQGGSSLLGCDLLAATVVGRGEVVVMPLIAGHLNRLSCGGWGVVWPAACM